MADSELTGANAAGTPPTGGATPAVGAKRGHWSSVWAALTWLPSKHPKLSSALVLFLGLFLLPQGALIEPIEFPSTAGYDGKVAASRLAHHLRVIQAEAISVRHVSSAPVIPFNSEYFSLPDLDIGAVSLDLGSLLRLLRHTITFGTKFISGEVTQAASSKLILTIQGSLGGSVSSIKVDGPSDDVDALLERAARAFLEQQAPLLMAVYWADASHPRREGETTTSLELVERALADREPRNDREAFILWGWLLSRQARYLEAVDKFQLAERRDGAKDPILYDNWPGHFSS